MQLEIGSIQNGKVTGVVAFGAFVELPDGQTGLVHISEVASEFVDDVSKFLKVGQEVKVKVVSVENGKIGLSIKKAN
ncbi:MAG: S1 RNA-binding domain-containing protein, partial [Clostridia bacterium]|nr:S1 RNA-binding domain-containing protein [Clostridia bacterium]